MGALVRHRDGERGFLVDGTRINSCLTLAVMRDGAEITTIEGLAEGDALHALQEAFVENDGLQCGYCTPGQVCSAAGMLSELGRGWPSAVTAQGATPALDGKEVRERMSGNLCRCGAYAGIVEAVLQVGAVDAVGAA